MVGDLIAGRVSIGFLLLLTCLGSARAVISSDPPDAKQPYQQAVTKLTAMATDAMHQIDADTVDWLPAVQRLIDDGKIDEAHVQARLDITQLKVFRDGSVRDLRAAGIDYENRLRTLRAFNLAMDLHRLVNGRLVPAVQADCDGSVRKFRALFADGSV